MMKQPSGPVVIASPTPATSARRKKSSSMTLSRGLRRHVLIAVVVIVAMPRMIVATVVVMPVLGMTMFGNGTVGMLHAAVRQMRVIMMVAIDGKRSGCAASKQPHIFRALADRLWRAPTADMPVEADDGVGRSHHDVKIVRD